MLDDGVKRDDQCERASEACGCESRAELRARIAELKATIDVMEGFLASATDLANSAARELDVEEARVPGELKGLIERLWIKARVAVALGQKWAIKHGELHRELDDARRMLAEIADATVCGGESDEMCCVGQCDHVDETEELLDVLLKNRAAVRSERGKK